MLNRLLLLALVSCGVITAQEEEFILHDGRTLTGVYDEQKGEILFTSGRIKGAVKVADSDIKSRKPAGKPSNIDQAVELDVLHLTDGRRLIGVYERERGILHLTGKIKGQIEVQESEIKKWEKQAREGKVEVSVAEKRKRWRSDKVANAQTKIREAKAERVRLSDAAIKLGVQIAKAEKAYNYAVSMRDQAEKDYRAALKEREDIIAADRTRAVPQAIQDKLKTLSDGYKKLRSNVGHKKLAWNSLQTELTKNKNTQVELAKSIEEWQEEAATFQNLINDKPDK